MEIDGVKVTSELEDLSEGSVVQNVLNDGMDANLHYKQIWNQARQKVKMFCELTGREFPKLKGGTNGEYDAIATAY